MKEKRRHTIIAKIKLEVDAYDSGSAEVALTDTLMASLETVDDVRRAELLESTIEQAPYVIPPGAERWAEAAEDIRFDDLALAEPRRIVVIHDGTWWWTDGHAALRCSGPPPDGYRKVDDSKWSKTFGEARRETKWGGAQSSDSKEVSGHASSLHPDMAVQSRYLNLITRSVRSPRWMALGPEDPMLVYEGDDLVAVVMPMRSGSLARRKMAS